jgi:hypothetical protein
MTSANESNSFPMGELTFKARAVSPSKKSNTAPAMMNAKANEYMPSRAYMVATQPEMRLQQVMELGMCLRII